MTTGQKIIKYIWRLILAVIIAASIFAGTFIVSQVMQVVMGISWNAHNPNGTLEEFTTYLLDYFNSSTGLLTVVTIRNAIMSVVFLLIIELGIKFRAFGNPVKALPKLTLPGTILGAAGLELSISAVLVTLGTIAPDTMAGYAEAISSTGIAELSVISTIASLLAAPICEELMFRGAAMKVLEKGGYNFWVANVIQAVLFGFIHLNIVQGLYAFVMGFLFGLLYKRTGKLWACIIAHITFNVVGTYGAALVYGNYDGNLVKVILPAVIGLVSLAAGVVMVAVGKEQSEEN